MSDRSLRLAVALNGYGLDHWAEDGGHRDILPWEDLRALGQQAEGLRYERIFMPEIGGREAFSSLSGLGAATERIGLATGVIKMTSRDLSTIGMGASSLHEMTGGRFVLGVGSGDSIERTRRQVQAVRQLVAGDDAVVSDPQGAWATGQLDWHTDPRRVPIYLAALGPRMVGLAGEVADGVILNWCTPERVAEARAAIPRSEGFTIAVYVRACLSHVDEQAAEALKVATARYLHMAPYRKQFEAMGLGEPAGQAAAALAGDHHPADAVPDELIDSLCVRGDPDLARSRLAEYAEAGADVVVVYPVPAGEAASSIKGTLMALAPDLADT